MEFDLRPHPAASIDETIERFPEGVVNLLKSSFRELGTLPVESRELLIKLSVEAIFSGFAQSDDDTAGALGIPVERSRLLSNASSLLATLVTIFKNSSAEEIFSSLERNKFVAVNDVHVREFVDHLVKNRARYTQEFEQRVLGGSVLPSLKSFDAAIDIRLPRGKERKSTVVAIASVDTDGEGQVIWFQLNKTQLGKLRDQFQELHAKFELAEKYLHMIDGDA